MDVVCNVRDAQFPWYLLKWPTETEADRYRDMLLGAGMPIIVERHESGTWFLVRREDRHKVVGNTAVRHLYSPSWSGSKMREIRSSERGWFIACSKLVAGNTDFVLVVPSGWRVRRLEQSVRELTAGRKVPVWRAYLLLLAHYILSSAHGGGYNIQASRQSDGSLRLCFQYPKEGISHSS